MNQYIKWGLSAIIASMIWHFLLRSVFVKNKVNSINVPMSSYVKPERERLPELMK